MNKRIFTGVFILVTVFAVAGVCLILYATSQQANYQRMANEPSSMIMPVEEGDNVFGFFRGYGQDRRAEWAEQIFVQLVETRP